VNSLVYPRMFEEAAIRRFAALGVPCPVLARGMEIAYRKPCFAGDRVRIALQAFTLGERWGAVGVVIPEGDVAAQERARPHCYVRMLFER
jgi:acyl-CoA thioesterase FadM